MFNIKSNKAFKVFAAVIAVFALISAIVVLARSKETGASVPGNATVAGVVEAFERIAVEAPKPVPEKPKTVKMAFVGDLMVHEWQFNDAYNKNSDSYDFNYCFDAVRGYLTEPDFTVGNLETTFAGKEAGYAWYPLFNAPDSFGEALKNAGFDFLTTANNHSNDKRKDGILRTIDVLDSLEIAHTGTFKSQKERDTVVVQEINSMRFAFLSYTYGTNGIALQDTYLANLLDDSLIKSDIERAKAQNVDFIIVMPHMGNEYEEYTREEFKNRIRGILEMGADVVIASHPHVLQPMEFINDISTEEGGERRAFAAYSTGNFISSQRTVPRDTGVIINLVFEKEKDKAPVIKSASYIPTWVKFTDINGERDVRVLSVFDALKANETGDSEQLALQGGALRDEDIARLKQVHAYVSKMLLGESLPLGEIRNEYEI